MDNRHMVRTTDRTGIIRLSDIPFYGDFILTLKGENDRIVFDSRIDGGDVSPLLCSAPVVSMEVKNNMFHITILEDLYPYGI